MIVVLEVFSNEHHLRAVVKMPDDEILDYIFAPGCGDMAPMHIELCQRYEAGEFNSMMQVEPPTPIEDLKSEALDQLSQKITATETRILGRVPKALRISLNDDLDLIAGENDVASYLESVDSQLDILTVADGE